jgi:hypothetical protein
VLTLHFAAPPGSNQFNLLIVVFLTLLILLLSVYVQKKLL